jgi:hypothetical protein
MNGVNNLFSKIVGCREGPFSATLKIKTHKYSG